MKKIKTIILIVYIVVTILISLGTIFLIVKVFTEGVKTYFQDNQIITYELPLNEKEIEKIIEDLKKYQLIQ